jgi:hypothetical protein
MEPIFTLPYSEYSVATELAKHFKLKDGYSIYAPLSRQEKGVDLLLIKRIAKKTKTLSIQVKSSRTYQSQKPKRETTIRYLYYTWFNRFNIPKEADIFILYGLYPPEEGRTKKISKAWWNNILLIFDNQEMIKFINNVKTVKGKPDRMFGFGFNNKKRIVLTRGSQNRNEVEYTQYLLENRIDFIENKLK